ncbi:MAG: FAD-dependent oxidoreductase [Candidatus Yanofskybacteria bacterium]|nr:FAD-dependent oxidoreductase [Candidatus Yanofskybacteria bacterium]
MIKVIVVGGGFGGIRAALDLAKLVPPESVEITLIDKSVCHVFIPALYEAASAFNMREDGFRLSLKRTVAIPFEEIFNKTPIKFIQAQVAKIDLFKRTVATKGGNILPYDYLVLALGSQAADFGVPGVRAYAHQFKTMQDALMVNSKIERLFTDAARSNKSQPVKFLIGGAGFTGIELAAELAMFSRKMMERLGMKGRKSIFYLFEAAPKILPMVSDRERFLIKHRLTQLGIVVMENTPIEEVKSSAVKLKNSQVIEGDMVIWTGGIEPSHLLRSVKGLELTDKGKVKVGEHLHIPNYKNVFAVGDIIEFLDHSTQKPVPALAYLAIDQGKIVARNIYHHLYGHDELEIHKPLYDKWIAPVGGKYAIAHVGKGIVIRGLLGWLIREAIDFRYFVSILPLGKAISFFWHEMRIFVRNDPSIIS